MALRDLSPDHNIDELLEGPDGQAEDLKPFSSRVKLIVEFNFEERRYVLNPKDEDTLQAYLKLDEFLETTRQIESKKSLRPFEQNSPWYRILGLWLISTSVLLLFIYMSLIILQLALFNFIMAGVMVVYLNKLYMGLHAIQYSQDYKYKNKGLKAFIEAENDRFYRNKNMELVGGELGKWLELQLPDDVEEQWTKEQMA